MGLFKKIFGGDQNISLEGLAKNLTNAAEKVVSKIESYGSDNTSSKPADSFGGYTAPAYEEPEQSGFSWGNRMPAEENQYNYPGNYVQYFAHIFAEDFPAYQAASEKDPKSSATIFTLYQAGRKALVVELKSESSESNRIRRACQMEGTPYLRFYYDHDGWWNTREYVVTRVRSALRI
ncbi:MAG: hypothetical protein IJM83_05395 [Firmicutes bacterium]|nr:hypothetical protein [Bacillota bacterium]